MPSGKKKRTRVREDPDVVEKRDDGAGLTSWARTLGAAAGFVRRLVTRDEPVDGGVLGSSGLGSSGLGGSGLGGGALDGVSARERAATKRDRLKVSAAFLSHQRRVKVEVRDLEAQLDRLHASITTGVVPPDAESTATTSALDTWILRSRELRERLQDKRSELARLQRTMAREDRLSSKDVPRSKRAPEDEWRPPPPRSNEKFSPSLSSERRRALVKALRTLIASLKQHSARRAVKRAARSLLDADADDRRAAVALLGGLDTPAVFDVLLVMAEDPSEPVRLATLNALAGLRRTAAAAVFRRFLGAESAPLRLAALRGLASLDASRLHGSELVAGIEDEDAGVRKAAAAILGWQQIEGAISQRVLASLTYALSDGAESVRLASVEALGAVGGQRAVFSLMRTLADPSEDVRAAGRRALRSIVGDEVEVIGAGLPLEERVEALRHWWKGARVQLVGQPAQNVPFDEPALRDQPAPQRAASVAPRQVEAPVAAAPPEPASAEPEAQVSSAEAQLPVSEQPASTRSDAPAELAETNPQGAEPAGTEPDAIEANLLGAAQDEDTSIFESDEEGGGDFESVMFEDDGDGAPDIAAKPAAEEPVTAKPAAEEPAAAASKEKAEETPEKTSAEATAEAKADEEPKKAPETAAAKDASEKADGDSSPAVEANGKANGDANGDADGASKDDAKGDGDDDELAIPGPSDAMDFGLDAEEQEGGEQFESLFGDGEGDEESSGDGGFESIMGDADSGE